MQLHTYKNYEEYKEKQIEANKEKFSRKWVCEKDIEKISSYIKQKGNIKRGLCHGVRNGFEITCFQKYIKNCFVIGTEISPTAKLSRNTIQLDFHTEVEEWKNTFDFVYSNSWDHSYDPELCFSVWLNQVSNDGFLILEHSRQHEDERSSYIDPFGCSIEELKELLKKLLQNDFVLEKIIDSYRVDREGKILIFRKNKQ